MPATSWLPAPSRAARGDVRSYHHVGINIFFGRLALWHFLMEDGTRSWDGDKGRMQDGLASCPDGAAPVGELCLFLSGLLNWNCGFWGVF